MCSLVQRTLPMKMWGESMGSHTLQNPLKSSCLIDKVKSVYHTTHCHQSTHQLTLHGCLQPPTQVDSAILAALAGMNILCLAAHATILNQWLFQTSWELFFPQAAGFFCKQPWLSWNMAINQAGLKSHCATLPVLAVFFIL